MQFFINQSGTHSYFLGGTIKVAIAPFWHKIGKFPPDNLFGKVHSFICHPNMKNWSLQQDKLDFSIHMTQLMKQRVRASP